jgi:hypothetical protein
MPATGVITVGRAAFSIEFRTAMPAEAGEGVWEFK